MDTQVKKQNEILDFTSFIKKYFDWYEIDGANQGILKNLSLWANRNPKFNGIEIGWHIDRGLLIYGNPGSGKDELLRITNQYLKYLGSPYTFSHRIVWEFATPFQAKENGGYACFSGEGKENRHYEELAFTDTATGYPTREVVNHFSAKVLIGAELIHVTHNAFKNLGVQSHFTTNEQEEKLTLFYGERSTSRLKYMCNFIKFNGRDRRENSTPVFMRNINQPPAPPAPKDLSKEVDAENKKLLEECYQNYLAAGEMPQHGALVYNSMWSYGVKMCTEDELREMMEDATSHYVPSVSVGRKTEREKEEAKRSYAWEESRKIALQVYYQLLKSKGAKSIFGEKEVDVDKIIETK